MLHRLNQEQLATSIFPLGELCKEEVRKIAEKRGFSVSQKKDRNSQSFSLPYGIKPSVLDALLKPLLEN